MKIMSAIWKYSWVVAFVEKIILLVWRFVALSFISCTGPTSEEPHHTSDLHAMYTFTGIAQYANKMSQCTLWSLELPQFPIILAKYCFVNDSGWKTSSDLI